MRRLLTSLASAFVLLLVLAPEAFAWNTGRGWYGPVNDKAITNIGMATIGFFAVLVLVLSLLQGRLEKRKAARVAAAQARMTDSTWRAGW